MSALSNESYKKLFYASQCCLLVLKPDAPDFTIIEVNDAYLNALNLLTDIRGKGLFEVLNGDKKKELSGNLLGFQQTLLRVMETKSTVVMEVHPFEIPIPGTADHERRFCISTNTPVLNENNEIEYILHSPVDVTNLMVLKENEQKAKEQAQEQKARFLSILKQLPVGVAIYKSADLIVEFMNPYLLGLHKKEEQELVGKSLIDVVGAIDDFEELSRYVSEQRPFCLFNIDVPFTTKGDERIYVSRFYQPYYEADGAISGVLVVVMDVSSSVILRKKLEESEHRLNLAIESSGLGVWDLDMVSGKSVPYFESDKIMGYNEHRESWTVDEFLQHVMEEDRETVLEVLKEANEKDRLQIHVRVKWPDESIHWVQLMGQVFRNEQKEPVRMLGTILDVTENKELERRKDELISIVSHELKTPITSLKAYAQVLERMFGNIGDVTACVMLKKMVIQIVRLTVLVHDLLDISRIEAGKLQLRNSEYSFDELVNETVSEVERTSSHKIVVKSTVRILCFGDRERTGQVLVNLLTNAIKYSPGKNKVLVTFGMERDEIVCCVQDFGVGIPKDKQQFIFDRFYRVQEEKNYSIAGLGLGLYISAEIIKRQNGRIWFKSQYGLGSTFCFSLPLKQQSLSVADS
ncbi:ATP-binding protein [Rubrolithibacter danxiaensis]|uniref:ATP-binding protein n=1 Tax=Rubrolithibacter danxiaensis TaxID=3390805 RepID=UPI003BF8FA96